LDENKTQELNPILQSALRELYEEGSTCSAAKWWPMPEIYQEPQAGKVNYTCSTCGYEVKLYAHFAGCARARCPICGGVLQTLYAEACLDWIKSDLGKTLAKHF